MQFSVVLWQGLRGCLHLHGTPRCAKAACCSVIVYVQVLFDSANHQVLCMFGTDCFFFFTLLVLAFIVILTLRLTWSGLSTSG